MLKPTLEHSTMNNIFIRNLLLLYCIIYILFTYFSISDLPCIYVKIYDMIIYLPFKFLLFDANRVVYNFIIFELFNTLLNFYHIFIFDYLAIPHDLTLRVVILIIHL